ncbi:MAG: M13 family metallopeptidase [Bacteriovoracaceae bacterium]
MKKLALASLGLLSFNIMADSVVMDPSLIDQSINPCDNFYLYACGNWLKNNEIPADKPRFMRFIEREDDNKKLLKEILERYSNGVYVPDVQYADKLGKLYNSCMNKFVNQEVTVKQLKELLSQVDSIKSVKEISGLTAELHKKGVFVFFSIGGGTDQMDAQKNIGYIDQNGFTLPEKGYYSRSGEKDLKDQEAYKQYISKLFVLAQDSSVEESNSIAERVFDVEKKFAEISLLPEEYNDPKITYNKIGAEGIKELSQNFNWDEYFDKINLSEKEKISITSKNYLKGFDSILSQSSLEDFKLYTKWMILNAYASETSQKLSDEEFNFRSKYMLGLEKRQDEWKSCVSYVDGVMGDALGAAYIEAVRFSPQSKANVNAMIDNIILSLKESIGGLAWMDQETKEGAYSKANHMGRKIGYPDKITDYSNYEVNSNNYFENSMKATEISFMKSIGKIGKEVDRSEWGMTAPTLNAYYQPTANEIAFPAGILSAPHYSDNDTLMANYGSTGAVIGHELSHAFDDQGSQYNSDGNLQNWWSQFSSEEFQKRAQCLVEQYDAYSIEDGTHLNGKLTLGENIADLGGVKLAYKALLKAKPDLTVEDKKAFFASFAQIWCAKLRPQYAKKQAQTNPHSLPEFRVNGVLVNLPEFSDTFQCSEDSKMVNKKRCSVW